MLALSGCSAPSPAAPILSKIPGCTATWTGPGNSLDNNTAAEGGCTLNDGTDLKLYMWPTWDTTDQENYIYQTAQSTSNGCSLQSGNSTGLALASGTDCIMGSTPAYLWFITLDIGPFSPSYAASLAPPIVGALHGQLVTRIPASWCTSGYCAPPASSPPSTQSPSSSPSPSPSPAASFVPPTPIPAPPATSAPAPSQTPAHTSTSGAWCTATANVYNAEYDWNNVYVHSNQPYTDATATADGDSFGYETDGSGYALIYLNGPPPGALITVTVGGATCTTSDLSRAWKTCGSAAWTRPCTWGRIDDLGRVWAAEAVR